MSRPKYVPSRRDLSKAWTVRKQGGKRVDICSRLGITDRQYSLNIAAFKDCFRREKAKLKWSKDAKAPANNIFKTGPAYRHGECILDPGNVDLDVLRSYVVCGFDREKIASALGVSRSTLHSFAKKHPIVQRILDHADEDVLADIYNNGLRKLCVEHELPDIVHASYMGEITTKNVMKKFNPSLRAIKYMFANKLSWATEPTGKKTNNKGAILQMLDELNNGEEEKEEDTSQQGKE